MTDVRQCPICLLWDASYEGYRPSGDGRAGEKLDCPRCGPFVASTQFLTTDLLQGKDEDTKRALLSHTVRKMQRENGPPPFLSTHIVEEILKGSLPSPFQQAENLVLWLGTHLNGPGEILSIHPTTHQSIVGSRTPAGCAFVLEHLFASDILTGNLTKTLSSTSADATLTFEGWRCFDQLHRGAASSRKAFMAMKYGDSTLDQCVDRAFRPALKKTGFTLQRLDDVPKAGLIDDRLRVDIRTSRFLIADLTHENAGAYWEAGFAEGLGKPVIYTCDKSKFDTAQTHFDTNHHLTVLWSADELPSFEEALKATIRATLPDEAILQDADPGTTEA